MITKKWRLAVVTAFVFLIPTFGWADPSQWKDEWDFLTHQPDAKITISRNANGDEIRDIVWPEKVSIHETRHGDKVESTAQDISGHGAVMCVWGIYTALRSVLDVCPTKTEDGELKEALDDAINRMNDFIVANSNTGVTKKALQDRINKQTVDTKEKLRSLSNDEHMKKCARGDTAQMLDSLRHSEPNNIKKSIDDLLSVPRPPVINPCL